MKRDLSIITDEVREDIQLWLDEAHYDQCPFVEKEEREDDDTCTKLCKAIFPKLPQLSRKSKYYYTCPCNAFSVKYIIKVAKEIIK